MLQSSDKREEEGEAAGKKNLLIPAHKCVKKIVKKNKKQLHD